MSILQFSEYNMHGNTISSLLFKFTFVYCFTAQYACDSIRNITYPYTIYDCILLEYFLYSIKYTRLYTFHMSNIPVLPCEPSHVTIFCITFFRVLS